MSALVARIALRFTLKRRMRQRALAIHPSHNPWKENQTEMNDPKFTTDDVELAEEMLTELLYLALTANDRLRQAWTTLAEGVSMIVSEEALERSKEYAVYRANQVG